MTPIIASFFKMAVPFLVIVSGLIALVLAHDPASGFALLSDGGQVNYDSALPLLIARYYPTGLIGLGVTALLAGFMAGQAGNIWAFNTVWTYDIYHAVINRNASDAHLLWMGRVATIVGIFLSVDHRVLGEELPHDHGLHAGDLLLGQRAAVRHHAARDVRALDHAGRGVLGAGAGMGSSFTLFLAVKFDWIDAHDAHAVDRRQRHGRQLLAGLVGMADLLRRRPSSSACSRRASRTRSWSGWSRG